MPESYPAIRATELALLDGAHLLKGGRGLGNRAAASAGIILTLHPFETGCNQLIAADNSEKQEVFNMAHIQPAPEKNASDVDSAVSQLTAEIAYLSEWLLLLKQRLASVLSGACREADESGNNPGQCELSKAIHKQAELVADLKDAVQFMLDDLKL